MSTMSAPSTPTTPVAVASDSIVITIKSQEGHSSPPMKVKRNSPLKEVLEFYRRSEGEEPGVLVYLWDGRRLYGKETPAELELEDEDEIHALKAVHGGGA